MMDGYEGGHWAAWHVGLVPILWDKLLAQSINNHNFAPLLIK